MYVAWPREFIVRLCHATINGNESTYTYGGAVAQSVERATPGEEVLGSISAVAAGSLLVWSVSV